jgi:hypothetical protein
VTEMTRESSSGSVPFDCQHREAQIASLKEATERLMCYVQHYVNCIRLKWDASEPTPDGGYRSRYAGVWYQTKPVDETPKCNCGAAAAIEAYEKVAGEI